MGVKTEIIEIALKFMESPAMINHLRSVGDMVIRHACEMVTASRSSLETKILALKDISSKVNNAIDELNEWEKERISNLDKLVTAGEFAINELTQNTPDGTIFLLTCYYASDWKFSEPYTSMEAVKRRRDNNTEYYSVHCDVELLEYEIEKWLPTQNGEMICPVSWHMGHEGIIWFAHINDKIEDWKTLSEDGEDLSPYSYNEFATITVPFVVGDIVTIDCRPSDEVRHAVIASKSVHENDCCGIQIMFITEESKLEWGALKHNRASHEQPPLFTCMYRLEKFTGELPEEESQLQIISEALKANPALIADMSDDEHNSSAYADISFWTK